MKQLPNTPKGVNYSDAPQRSDEWIQVRVGRVGASQLGRWLSVSKPNKDGECRPLKARLDLEKEIAFEKAFNVPFSMYQTGAMQAGIDNEPVVRQAYEAQTGNTVETAGCFYDEYSVASPDGLIGEDGGLEIKWLQDTNFMEVLSTHKPLPDHYLQIQGNLRLTGRKWWDYAVGNGNTGRFLVIRVERDEDTIASITQSVADVAKVEPFDTTDVYTLQQQVNNNNEEEILWT